MKRPYWLLAVGAAFALAVTACGSNDDSTTATGGGSASGGGDLPTIAMTTYSRSFEFYQDIEKGAEEAAAGKAELDLRDPNGDLAAQLANVESFIAQNADLVAIVPIDSNGAAAAGQLVTSAGIPLMTVDIAINEDVGQITHIASDNIEGGRLAGEKMIELVDSGQVAVITNPAITSVVDRQRGFEEALQGSDLELVTSQNGESKRAVAQAVAEDMLQRYPDLKGIFAVNDEMGLGALQAVVAAGRENEVSIIGFDASAEGLKEIRAGGPFKATVAQDPVRIGRTVVETALKILDGEEVPKEIPVPVKLIDAANVDSVPGA